MKQPLSLITDFVDHTVLLYFEQDVFFTHNPYKEQIKQALLQRCDLIQVSPTDTAMCTMSRSFIQAYNYALNKAKELHITINPPPDIYST